MAASSSYKNAVETEYIAESNITKYTYDEAMSLLENMRIKPIVQPSLSEERLDFICEQNDFINGVYLDLKVKYESAGFLNTMTFKDFNEIILQNVQVDRVVDEEQEDNELSFDDEEW